MRSFLLVSLALVCGLAYVVGDYAMSAPDNIILWHIHEATDKAGTTMMSILVPALQKQDGSMSTPQLYVVPETASITTVLKTIHLSECQMLHGNNKEVSGRAPVASIARVNTITCNGASNRQYNVQQFQPENFKAKYTAARDAGAFPLSAGKNDIKEYPYLATEILGNTILADLQWLENFIRYHWGPLHAFPSYVGTDDTGIYSLSTGRMLPLNRTFDPSRDMDEVRMGLTADWGAGTREADYVQSLMMKDYQPHYTFHIGDVYYVGTVDEVKSNLLGVAPPNVTRGVAWPHGSRGAFGLNGNHEMYTRGIGYFDHFLPTLGVVNDTTGKLNGQKASFLSLENAFWRVISLDTGYNTYSAVGLDNKTNVMPQAHVDWLIKSARIADPRDTRPIIFLSHHQYFSAWESGYLSTPKQLAALLPAGRVPLWIWGHEHRLSFYDKTSRDGVNMTCYARCIGVGGFPATIQKIPKDPIGTRLTAYDNRLYVVENGTFHLPVGYNGFMRMTFKGPLLQADYYSLQMDAATGKPSNTVSTWLVSETFGSDGHGNVVQKSFTVMDKDITVVTHLDEKGNVILTGDSK